MTEQHKGGQPTYGGDAEKMMAALQAKAEAAVANNPENTKLHDALGQIAALHDSIKPQTAPDGTE